MFTTPAGNQRGRSSFSSCTPLTCVILRSAGRETRGGTLNFNLSRAADWGGLLEPNPEIVEWLPVVGLKKEKDAKQDSNDFRQALMRLSPDQGSYVLMSMRRREIKSTDVKKDEEGDESKE